jgi:hypothetical protein
VIEWIDILTSLAVVLAVLGTVLLSMVLINFARHALKISYWWTLEKKIYQKAVTEKPQEEKRMSKEKGEGVTFNDIFMFMIAVPLVLLWVGFAGFVIHTGLNNAAVLENIEAYTTLIAILGGPALLIIKDALDVWKQEQAEKTAFYKVKAQAVIDYNDANQKQAQMIETKAQDHEHKSGGKK